MLKGGISTSETWLCGFPQVTQGSSPRAPAEGERVLGSTIHPTALPMAMPSASPTRVLLLGKQSLRVTFRPSRALAGGTLPGMRFVPGPLLRVVRPPRASPGRYCSPCMGKTRLLEDCDYPSLNRTSTPQAVFKTEPWSFPQLPCQWKPQERQICFFQCNF